MGELHASRHDSKRPAWPGGSETLAISVQLRTRRRDTPASARRQWVEKWIGQPIEQWDEQEKPKVLQDWKIRRTEDSRRAERIVRPGTDPGGTVPEDIPPNRAVLKLHSGLRKAESSVLVQARTGRIGLAKFLYSCKVPGILSTQCRCGAGEETPRHMSLYCTEETERRQHLRTGRRLDYQQLIGTNSGARKLAEWMIRSGRLGQFTLARRLLYS